MFNAVGGSTILYAAHFPRFHPSDFRVRTLDGVADDWPLDYRQLEPYYDVNARMMGVSGLAGDPAYPPKEVPLPPVPLGKLGETLARGFNRLGWHWWPSDSAIATRDYEGRAPCINAGTCLIGCAQGAKAQHRHHLLAAGDAPRRRACETRCRVREITVGANGMADGVIYYDAEGVERRQKAHVVVVACNGIGTPRLLLNSRSKQFPDGLANRSGLVGKNLMFHPYGMVTGIFDEPLEGYKGPTGCCIMSQEFYETDRVARLRARLLVRDPARLRAGVRRRCGACRRGGMPWGADHHRAYAELFDRTAGMVVICEDLPEETNRVTLDPQPHRRERHPGAEDHLPAEREQHHACWRTRWRARSEVLDGVGRARDRVVDAPLPFAGWHLMGTARMGTDPERLGGERVGTLPRRPQPLHHRRQHLRHRGGGESRPTPSRRWRSTSPTR